MVVVVGGLVVVVVVGDAVVFAGLLPGPDPAEARDDVPKAASRLMGPLFEHDAISTDESAAANKVNARPLDTNAKVSAQADGGMNSPLDAGLSRGAKGPIGIR